MPTAERGLVALSIRTVTRICQPLALLVFRCQCAAMLELEPSFFRGVITNLACPDVEDAFQLALSLGGGTIG